MQSQNSGPEEPPRVMTLWEVLRTLKYIAADDRIKGIVADFSHDALPNVPAETLGLAQIEELLDAIEQLKVSKEEQLGKGKFRTAAFADTFVSQGDYLLASAFDKIYIQPSGEIALTGLSASIPFWSRLLQWLGVDVLAETRNEYKSVVAPYTAEELSPAQRRNEEELLADLHENFCRELAANRFAEVEGEAGIEKVKGLAFRGPFSASEALKEKLIDGVTYRRQVLGNLMGEEAQETKDSSEEDKEYNIKGFYHYAKVMEKAVGLFETPTMDVGVVYLLGGIDLGSGEFGTSSVVKGLREAAADDSIGAVVLRIDSGGGAVVPSDTIHNAVRELQEKGKIVVASFANAAASGGYLVCTHADAILANPSTITGSIGVAAMRPTFTSKFLDKFLINVQSFFNGSKYDSLMHPLEGEDLARFKRHVDEHYSDFKARVSEGREISPDVIDYLAGGRVMTGSKAFSLIEPANTASSAPASSSSSAESGAAQQAVEHAMTDNLIAPLPSIKDDAAATPSSVAAEPSEEGARLPLPAALLEIFRRSFAGHWQSEAPAVSPLGRGLIDGLGGIADAAILAAEIFLSRAIVQLQVDNPGMTDEEALQEVLPDFPHTQSEDGTMQLAIDVNLKRFPSEKGFWQTLLEQTARGDGIDPNTVRMAFLSMLGGVLAQELEKLGLGSALSEFAGLRAGRRPWTGIRMEEPLARRVRL